MKKIVCLIAGILLMVGCCGSGNQGYGYNTKAQTTEQTQAAPSSTSERKGYFETLNERRKTHTMVLRGTDGRYQSSCTVYKGEFDGHTWYVFYDDLAAPSVVHDPNCKCLNKDKEE